MRLKRSVHPACHGVLLLALLTLVSGCGSGATTPSTTADGSRTSAPPKPNDEAALYVSKALDLAKTKDKEQAYYALMQAQFFGVQGEQVKKALDPLHASRFGAVTDPAENRTIARLGQVLQTLEMPIDALTDMVQVTKSSNKQEVAILEDSDLVGDGRITPMPPDSPKWLVFLRPVQIPIEEILSRHGKPQKEHTSAKGARLLFYGRVVVIQPADGKPPLLLRFAQPGNS